MIYKIYDSKKGETKWSRSKDSNEVNCSYCKLKIPQNQFMEHFEHTHPEVLNWSLEESNKSHEQIIG